MCGSMWTLGIATRQRRRASHVSSKRRRFASTCGESVRMPSSFLYLACLTCNLEIPFSATVKSTYLELGTISAAGTDRGQFGSLDVGISQPQPSADQRRLQVHLYPSIEGTLRCLVALFQNATNLRQKYGVEPTATSVSRPAGHQDLDPDNLESNTQPTGIDFPSLTIEPAASHGLISKRRRFQWAVRDAERFKELVNEVREIIDSLCSVLDLGRRAHLNRQLLEKALSVDVPDGLATI